MSVGLGHTCAGGCQYLGSGVCMLRYSVWFWTSPGSKIKFLDNGIYRLILVTEIMHKKQNKNKNLVSFKNPNITGMLNSMWAQCVSVTPCTLAVCVFKVHFHNYCSYYSTCGGRQVGVGWGGGLSRSDTPQSFHYTPQNIKSHISNQGGEKLLARDSSACDSHVSSCLYVSNCVWLF